MKMAVVVVKMYDEIKNIVMSSLLFKGMRAQCGTHSWLVSASTLGVLLTWQQIMEII